MKACGLSPDGMATWEYEIIGETWDGKYIVKAVNHPNEGLLIMPKEKLQIREEK